MIIDVVHPFQRLVGGSDSTDEAGDLCDAGHVPMEGVAGDLGVFFELAEDGWGIKPPAGHIKIPPAGSVDEVMTKLSPQNVNRFGFILEGV